MNLRWLPEIQALPHMPYYSGNLAVNGYVGLKSVAMVPKDVVDPKRCCFKELRQGGWAA